MRIGYFGDGPWAVQAIHKLLGDKNFTIAFVVVRYQSGDQALRIIAKKNNLPLLEFPKINAEDCLQKLGEFKCDLWVSMSFDQIFKDASFKVPKYGIINCHAGDLPRYRGRNIINWAIINGEERVGITVHTIDAGIDTGNIIRKDYVQVTLEDDYKTVLEKCFFQCAETLYLALQKIAEDPRALKGEPQVGEGFYCKRRGEKDELVDWNQPALRVHNFIRAITRPAPGAKTTLDGKTVRLWKSKPPVQPPAAIGLPGTVANKNGSLWINTAQGQLEITDWNEEN
jgi:methionyl-tRNA formyltransferase